MESIFLILSGVILVAGVLYWLWSHIQLTQKKVQLLENAVFELRGMLANSGGGSQGPGSGAAAPAPSSPTRQVQVTPATAAAAAMLSSQLGGGAVGVSRADDDDADAENGWDGSEHKSMPLDALDAPVLETHELLRPGGSMLPASLQAALEETDTPIRASTVIEKLERTDAEAEVGTVEIDLDAPALAPAEEASADQFRNLFAVQEKSVTVAASPSVSVASAAAPAATKAAESLESMPVKELRRLAEQRGIAGVADMRKKDILTALRQQVTTSMTLSEDAEAGVATGDSDIREVAIESAEILE
jgi:hypothetical protein